MAVPAGSDLVVACYHSKLGAVELHLNHLVDGSGEYVVVDMTAGADAFASGLFTRFDLTFLVAEPTRKGVSVRRRYRAHAEEFGISLAVVGNKVNGEDALLFLKEQVRVRSHRRTAGRSTRVRRQPHPAAHREGARAAAQGARQ